MHVGSIATPKTLKPQVGNRKIKIDKNIIIDKN